MHYLKLTLLHTLIEFFLLQNFIYLLFSTNRSRINVFLKSDEPDALLLDLAPGLELIVGGSAVFTGEAHEDHLLVVRDPEQTRHTTY